MVRVENFKGIIDKLKEILLDKPFSGYVKNQISETIARICILDLNSDELEKYIYDVIEGLKLTRIFEIDCKENLLKSEIISRHLGSNTVGFVTMTKEIVAIVKKGIYEICMSHECAHLSQEYNSYSLPEKYDCSTIFQLAMLEGEACYHESLYMLKYCPTFLHIYNTKIRLQNHNAIYNKFFELYQDMQNILGKDLLYQWKKNINENFMVNIEVYMQEHYQCSFAPIYQCWISILYQYLKLDSKYKQEIEQTEHNRERNCNQYHDVDDAENNCQQILLFREGQLQEYISILQSPDCLKEEYYKKKKEGQIGLEEYIKRNGEDDVSKEWEEELNTTTIQDYQRIILNEKLQLEGDIEGIKNKLANYQKEKDELEYYLSFQRSEQIGKYTIEELEQWKEQQLAVLGKSHKK